MIKTVTLASKELKADGLGGFNTVVQNLSGGTLYASKYPNIVPGADNVAEIPPGSLKLISTTNGTVYLLGTGKAELTGQDYEGVNSAGGGGGAGSGNAATVNGHTVNADVPSNAKFTDTTYTNATTTKDGLMSSSDKSKLDGIAAGANKYTHPTTAGNKHIPAGGSSGQILRWSSDGTAVWGADNNTTYSAATQSANGLMSSSDKSKLDGIAAGANNYVHPTTSGNKHIPAGGSSGQILRWSADGTAAWGADNNTTYSDFVKSGSGAKSGLVPSPGTTAGTTKYLREDGTWSIPLTPSWVQTAETDLNDYTTAGVYFFYKAQSPLNAPISGINGWLLVFAYGSGVEAKQVWFRLGDANSTDYDTFVRTKVSGVWSNWRKIATAPAAASPMQVVGITQGTLNSVTTTAGISYIPYQSGASKALVEIWKTASNFSPNYSATSYGGRYITGLSSSMTAVSNVTVFTGVLDTATVGADSTGRIAVGGSICGDDDTHYRVTWFV